MDGLTHNRTRPSPYALLGQNLACELLRNAVVSEAVSQTTLYGLDSAIQRLLFDAQSLCNLRNWDTIPEPHACDHTILVRQFSDRDKQRTLDARTLLVRQKWWRVWSR